MISFLLRLPAPLATLGLLALAGCSSQSSTSAEAPIRIVRGVDTPMFLATVARGITRPAPAIGQSPSTGPAMASDAAFPDGFDPVEDAREEAAQAASREADPYRLQYADPAGEG